MFWKKKEVKVKEVLDLPKRDWAERQTMVNKLTKEKKEHELIKKWITIRIHDSIKSGRFSFDLHKDDRFYYDKKTLDILNDIKITCEGIYFYNLSNLAFVYYWLKKEGYTVKRKFKEILLIKSADSAPVRKKQTYLEISWRRK